MASGDSTARRRSLAPPFRALALFALSGALLALSFPPFGPRPLVAWAAVPGVAALCLAVRGLTGSSAAIGGALTGLVFNGVLLQWIRILGLDAWIALTLYSALWFALLGFSFAWVMRLRAWPLWIALAWSGVETLRSHMPLGGFPWGRLAYGQESTPLVGFAWLTGTWGTSIAVALLGGLLAWVATRPRARTALAAVTTGLLVVAGGLGLLHLIPQGSQTARIAAVQGSVPRTGLDAYGQRRAVLANHVRATQRLAQAVRAGEEPQPVAVIWPENSSDIDPFLDPSAAEDISSAVDDIGAPTLVGLVIDSPEGYLNTGMVWLPESGPDPAQSYVKRHPVPFGEYLPMRGLLQEFITRFDRLPKDFVAGERAGVLDMGGVSIGDVICFEIAYGDIVRDAVRQGAQVVAVQTNNATYGRTGQPQQQLAITQVQAVEHGREVLVAATSGVSVHVTARGQVLGSVAEFEWGWINNDVRLSSSVSPADRGMWALEWLALVAGVVAVLAAIVRSRRSLEAPTAIVSASD